MIIFTHIPKTAGSSFYWSLIEPNTPDAVVYRYRGLRRLLLDRGYSADVVRGHAPYGVHVFAPRTPAKYITILREPVDRSVSYYYFVKDSGREHPDRADAESLTLTSFFSLRKYQNWQTRYLAGIPFHRLYGSGTGPVLDRVMLRAALTHLVNRYVCFGIQENFESSLALAAHSMQWPERKEMPRLNFTRDRPDVATLTSAELQSVRESNALDCELYEQARALFELRCREIGVRTG
jgi:hypothetical protein